MLKKILPFTDKLADSVKNTLSNKTQKSRKSKFKSTNSKEPTTQKRQAHRQSNKKTDLVRDAYRSISTHALDVAVKPQLVGELPVIEPDDQTLTFYVLQEYSRSNSILIDSVNFISKKMQGLSFYITQKPMIIHRGE